MEATPPRRARYLPLLFSSFTELCCILKANYYVPPCSNVADLLDVAVTCIVVMVQELGEEVVQHQEQGP
jgi:hypothetical protein